MKYRLKTRFYFPDGRYIKPQGLWKDHDGDYHTQLDYFHQEFVEQDANGEQRFFEKVEEARPISDFVKEMEYRDGKLYATEDILEGEPVYIGPILGEQKPEKIEVLDIFDRDNGYYNNDIQEDMIEKINELIKAVNTLLD